MTYEGRDLEVLADMPNYYGWIMSWFAPYVRGRVVEYGAGAGTVSKLLRPLADRLTLVEPSANLLPVLQARFPRDPGVEIGQGDAGGAQPAAAGWRNGHGGARQCARAYRG